PPRWGGGRWRSGRHEHPARLPEPFEASGCAATRRDRRGRDGPRGPRPSELERDAGGSLRRDFCRRRGARDQLLVRPRHRRRDAPHATPAAAQRPDSGLARGRPRHHPHRPPLRGAWALAQMLKNDYARAHVPMLPVVAGDVSAKRQTIVYAVLTVAVSLVPFFTGSAGPVYLGGAIVLGAGLVGIALLDLEGKAWTRRLWRYSMVYVAVLFMVFALSPFLP